MLASWIPAKSHSLKEINRSSGIYEQRLGSSLSPVLFLGQSDDRSQRVSERSQRCLNKATLAIENRVWTADRISLEQFRQGLQCGSGLAFYYGHGRASGWAAYHGLRICHLELSPPEPLGCLVAATCHRANRAGKRLSFAEHLVAEGIAGVLFAATEKSVHLENAWISSDRCEQLPARSASRFYEVFSMANFPENIARSRYRIIGYLTTPLASSEKAL